MGHVRCFDSLSAGLQGALVLACGPGCKAMGMRLAGQGGVARIQRSGIRELCPSPLEGEGLGRGGAVASIGCCVVLCADARHLGREFVPHAEILSFASPKESIQRKGDPTFAPCAALRVPCASPAMRPLRNSPAASRLPQTVLADPSALRCDARRSRREPVRGGASDIWLRSVLFFVGCNQRASALHRMAGLSQTSGAMRCASIAPYPGLRRSDFSPTAALTRHRVGLKSDLQALRWSRVGNVLPTQSGGQPAAHPTQAARQRTEPNLRQFNGATPSPQPLPRQGGGAKTAPLQPALLLPRSPACKPIGMHPAGQHLNGGRHA